MNTTKSYYLIKLSILRYRFLLVCFKWVWMIICFLCVCVCLVTTIKSKTLFLIGECSGEQSLMLYNFLLFQRSSVLFTFCLLVLASLNCWRNMCTALLSVFNLHSWSLITGGPLVLLAVVPFFPSTLILLLSPR